MREAQLASREGNHDLSGVVMPGKDEVIRVVDLRRDPGKVTEQDSETRALVCKRLGPSAASGVGLRIDADDLHTSAPNLDLDARVAEQGDTCKRADRSRIDALRERVAAVGEVVVPEDDEARGERSEKSLQERHPRSARDEISSDTDEIWAPLDDPGDGILDRAPAPRRDSEMEVGQVRDPEAVELGRTPRHLDLEDAAPEPTGFEPSPGHRGHRR